MPLDESETVERRLLEKPVLESRLLDDMEDLSAWMPVTEMCIRDRRLTDGPGERWRKRRPAVRLKALSARKQKMGSNIKTGSNEPVF